MAVVGQANADGSPGTHDGGWGRPSRNTTQQGGTHAPQVLLVDEASPPTGSRPGRAGRQPLVEGGEAHDQFGAAIGEQNRRCGPHRLTAQHRHSVDPYINQCGQPFEIDHHRSLQGNLHPDPPIPIIEGKPGSLDVPEPGPGQGFGNGARDVDRHAATERPQFGRRTDCGGFGPEQFTGDH